MILLMNAIGAHHDEIEMKSFDFIKLELDYERDDELYFTTKGRKLTSSKGKRKKGKGKGPCFKFVYPISYTMADSSIISGNNRKEIHSYEGLV